MLLIQIILIAAVLVVAVQMLRNQGARLQAIRRLLLGGFALFAVATILFPSLWSEIARMVGVGRGTDLLLYGLMVAFFGYVATSYSRGRQLEARLTDLARRIALDEVPTPRGGKASLPGADVPGPHGGSLGKDDRGDDGGTVRR